MQTNILFVFQMNAVTLATKIWIKININLTKFRWNYISSIDMANGEKETKSTKNWQM